MSYRSWALCCLCLLLATAAIAEVAPQRLLLLRGAIALADNRPADALADLRQAADLQPEDWQCQMLYGQALARAGQPLLAKGQLRRAALLAPWRPEPWQTMAREARTLGDVHLEFAALAGLTRIVPDSPAAQRRLAELYRTMGQPEAADKLDAAWQASLPALKLVDQYVYNYRFATLAELRQLAEQDPTDAQVLAALATAEWQAGNQDAAREALRRLCNLNRRDPLAIANYAHLCLLAGQTAAGLQALRDGLLLDDEPLLRAYARWSLADGRFADAVEPLQRLVARYPGDGALLRQLGTAALLSGDAETALAHLQLAWQKTPDHLTAQAYAAALQQQGRFLDAEQVLQQAITRFPDESMLKVMLTLVYRDTGRSAACVRLTTEVARVRPETVELTLLAGERALQAGMVGQAFTTAFTLANSFPADALAVQSAVSLYRRLADTSAAQLALTRYLGPNMTPALSRTEVMLQLAQMAAAGNRLGEAAEALQELLVQQPDCRPAYVLLGKVRMQQEDWGEAVRLYAEAHKRWPTDVQMTLALARAAARAGDSGLAERTYLQATAAKSADAWLELGVLYHSLGSEGRARDCWRMAGERPDGKVRAGLYLLASYEGAGEVTRAADARADVATLLTAERQLRAKRWREALAAQGLAGSDEEIDSLLLLDTTLADPGLLQRAADGRVAAQQGEPQPQ